MKAETQTPYPFFVKIAADNFVSIEKKKKKKEQYIES